MEELKKHIYDGHNGLHYTLVGDYYIPDLELPEETRPIGIWGRMHKDYLEQYHPAQYNDLILSGNLWAYLADLNEQAQNRLNCIIAQMKEAEGITEELKSITASRPMELSSMRNGHAFFMTIIFWWAYLWMGTSSCMMKTGNFLITAGALPGSWKPPVFSRNIRWNSIFSPL